MQGCVCNRLKDAPLAARCCDVSPLRTFQPYIDHSGPPVQDDTKCPLQRSNQALRAVYSLSVGVAGLGQERVVRGRRQLRSHVPAGLLSITFRIAHLP